MSDQPRPEQVRTDHTRRTLPIADSRAVWAHTRELMGSHRGLLGRVLGLHLSLIHI